MLLYCFPAFSCDNRALDTQTQMHVHTHTQQQRVRLFIFRKSADSHQTVFWGCVARFFSHAQKKIQIKASPLSPPTAVVRERQVHN